MPSFVETICKYRALMLSEYPVDEIKKLSSSKRSQDLCSCVLWSMTTFLAVEQRTSITQKECTKR